MNIRLPPDMKGYGKCWHCFCSISCVKTELIKWRKQGSHLMDGSFMYHSDYAIGEHNYETNLMVVIREFGNETDHSWLDKYLDMLILLSTK